MKGLLDKEAKRIAKAAMEVAGEDGRKTERESHERQLRLTREKTKE